MIVAVATNPNIRSVKKIPSKDGLLEDHYEAELNADYYPIEKWRCVWCGGEYNEEHEVIDCVKACKEHHAKQ